MKYMIDCGANLGQGFERLRRIYDINEFQIEMYEPNTICYHELLNKYPNKNIKIYNMAVSNSFGRVPFNIEYCIHEKDWVGGASHILNDGFERYKNYPKKFNQYPELNKTPTNCIQNNVYSVPCIDLSQTIKMKLKEIDFLVLKLDIEGSEFAVLDKMMADDTLKYVDDLYVEWHDHLFRTRPSNNKYLDEIGRLGINYKEWI